MRDRRPDAVIDKWQSHTQAAMATANADASALEYLD
jgi:hypothetical protein